jgi:hypothetical protein
MAAAPRAGIDIDYLMRLHTPGAGPPLRVDSSLAIYRAGAEGWVTGPRIGGKIVLPTADWLRTMPSGSLRVDARMTLETDDGAIIHVSYGGVISASKENFERLAKGTVLTAAEMYFITAPVFQTAHPGYDWLNHIQALGKLVAVKGGEGGFVTYDVFAAR